MSTKRKMRWRKDMHSGGWQYGYDDQYGFEECGVVRSASPFVTDLWNCAVHCFIRNGVSAAASYKKRKCTLKEAKTHVVLAYVALEQYLKAQSGDEP